MENLLSLADTWIQAHIPSLVRIVFILVGAVILNRVVVQLAERLERLTQDEDPSVNTEREKRAQTLGRILRQVLAVLIWVVAGMMILGEIGLDLGPILAGAGIAGLAIGFGAQTLVKDIIAGFFILLENQFRVNDIISTAGVTGLVERINLRTTVLRDVEGRVHIVPNGEIAVVSNFTQSWSRAVLDVGVAYREDTDRCFEVLKGVGAEMERDARFRPKLAGAFEYPGVEQLGDSAVVLRMQVKTRPEERLTVLRELRRRVKKAFDAAGVEIPYPHLTLYVGEADAHGRIRVELQGDAGVNRS